LIFEGILLCLGKEKLIRAKSGLVSALPFRYLILLMGFFAFYCGTIYNEFLSIPTNFFGSCYVNEVINPAEPNLKYGARLPL